MKFRFANSEAKPKNTPGPGAYDFNTVDKRRFPSYGFGSGTREQAANAKRAKLNVPGPGTYKLVSGVGDVPQYAMPDRNDEFKYV